MVKKKSVKREVIIVPNSIEEVSKFIGEIGKHQRELDKLQTGLNNRVEEIKAKTIANSLPHQEKISQLFEGIFVFVQSHRDELTENNKKKTVHFPTGDVLWRLTPPAISYKNAKKIISLCKSLGLERFIRIKEEVDKEAMLKEPDEAARIKGVKICQKEEFVVKPSEIEIEISGTTEKLRKKTGQE